LFTLSSKGLIRNGFTPVTKLWYS